MERNTSACLVNHWSRGREECKSNCDKRGFAKHDLEKYQDGCIGGVLRWRIWMDFGAETRALYAKFYACMTRGDNASFATPPRMCACVGSAE